MGGKACRPSSSVSRPAQMGHGAPMVRPRESASLDFEGEIAMIIGRAGRRIPRAKALEHVAGFGIYNDGSVREWQRHTSQFTPGKNFASTGGFGPWMMTPDEIGDLDEMEITTRLNGEVMQNAKAALLVHGFAELIEFCSTFIELVPGDVIVTGTPGGVGAAAQSAGIHGRRRSDRSGSEAHRYSVQSGRGRIATGRGCSSALGSRSPGSKIRG